MASAAPQTVYRDEFIAAFGQRQSLLKDTTTRETMIKGNVATFLVTDSAGTAVTRGVNGLIPAGENSNTQTNCTISEKHDLREMTGFNIFQSQGNQREIMQLNTMSVINRDIDLVILTALAATSLDTGAAATASLLMIGKAMATMMNAGVPWDGNVFAAISGSFLIYLMAIDTFASADFVNVKPAMSFPGWNADDPKKPAQGWWDWMGVKWIVSNQLTGVGTASETCIMYHRNAIGHAVDKGNIDSAIGYEAKQQLSWARCSLFHGAVLLQNAGAVRMIHDGSAHVAT
ncbi:MAG: phage capsid protein [Tepidisphaeraceae bacterium]